jgi:hypothetical protein
MFVTTVHTLLKAVVLLALAAVPLQADGLYSFTTFHIKLASATQAKGINNAGQIGANTPPARPTSSASVPMPEPGTLRKVIPHEQ